MVTPLRPPSRNPVRTGSGWGSRVRVSYFRRRSHRCAIFTQSWNQTGYHPVSGFVTQKGVRFLVGCAKIFKVTGADASASHPLRCPPTELQFPHSLREFNCMCVCASVWVFGGKSFPRRRAECNSAVWVFVRERESNRMMELD